MTNTTIGERIKDLRKSLNLTQTEFGEKLGTVANMVSMWEKGMRIPNERQLILISSVYSIRREWLESGDGEMFNELSRDEQIAQFIGETLGAEDDTFQKRLISALSKMSVEEWEALEGLINRLAESTKKESE